MIKPPIVRSVRRDEQGVRVSWFELFYDLVVVASVSHGSHLFGEHPSWGMGWWLAASLVLLMTFWLLTMVSYNIYPNDDLRRRLLVLVQMVALVVASLSLGRGDESLPDSVGFGALAVAFASLALVFWHCARQSPDAGRAARVLAPWSLLSALIMLVGVFTDSHGELFSNPITWVFTAGMLCGILPLLFLVLNHRTTSEQIDGEHVSERMGQLVLIVLGESFVSLVFSLSTQSSIPNPWYFLLDFVVVFSIWSLYFIGVMPAGVPGTAGRLRAWLGLHFILIFGAIAAAGGFAALALIPFGASYADHGSWTPLPLFYVMIGMLGLSILARHPRSVWALEAVITVILGVLSVLALWVVPDESRWLTLIAAGLIVFEAIMQGAMARRRNSA